MEKEKMALTGAIWKPLDMISTTRLQLNDSWPSLAVQPQTLLLQELHFPLCPTAKPPALVAGHGSEFLLGLLWDSVVPGAASPH